MTETSSQQLFLQHAQDASASTPGFSPLPALTTLIDEAPETLLRNCLKLVCQRTEEDACTVGLMLEEAKYCEDSDDEDSGDLLDYEPFRVDDPVADTLFQALLSRLVILEDRRKEEKSRRKEEMARSREQQRAVQRNNDEAAQMFHDYDDLVREASGVWDYIQKLNDKSKRHPHRSARHSVAIEKAQALYRMKSNAASQLQQCISSLNAIPPRLVHCGYCNERFDANRRQPEACRRHRGTFPSFNLLLRQANDCGIGTLEFNWSNGSWPHIWDAEDDVEGVIASMTKDLVGCPHAKDHQHSLPYLQWTCCQRSGDSIGCNIGKHEEKRN